MQLAKLSNAHASYASKGPRFLLQLVIGDHRLLPLVQLSSPVYTHIDYCATTLLTLAIPAGKGAIAVSIVVLSVPASYLVEHMLSASSFTLGDTMNLVGD